MINFTAEQTVRIFNKIKFNYCYCENLELKKDRYGYLDIDDIKSETTVKCFCNIGKDKIIKGTQKCSYCEQYGNIIFSKKNTKLVNDRDEEGEKISWKIKNISNTYSYNNFYYVCKNPDDKFSLIIVKLKAKATINDKNEITEELKVENIIYINSNIDSKAYKISRNKQVEIDFFDAFNLNSKTAKNDINIIWEDADNMLEFFIKNEEVSKRLGVFQCFSYTDINMSRNAFFMFYMFLYCKYPVIELLTKMNNSKLVSQMINDLSSGYNKENIKEKAENLNKLLNPEATKGNAALRIPKYISDFLSLSEAGLTKYLYWCDLYEITNISKEYFEELINEGVINNLIGYVHFPQLLNVLRYGYDLKKLSNYIKKQMQLNMVSAGNVLGQIDDYRNMSNIMEVEAEEYPADIKKVHDSIMKAYKANINELSNKALSQIAEKVNKVKIEDDEYEIVVPTCIVDFVNEGNAQHNCVSSYVNKVINRKCIVFFIRKKEDIKQSFVTAEFSNNCLYQIMYKNNVRVWDEKILRFANKFCDKLKGLHLVC